MVLSARQAGLYGDNRGCGASVATTDPKVVYLIVRLPIGGRGKVETQLIEMLTVQYDSRIESFERLTATIANTTISHGLYS